MNVGQCLHNLKGKMKEAKETTLWGSIVDWWKYLNMNIDEKIERAKKKERKEYWNTHDRIKCDECSKVKAKQFFECDPWFPFVCTACNFLTKCAKKTKSEKIIIREDRELAQQLKRKPVAFLTRNEIYFIDHIEDIEKMHRLTIEAVTEQYHKEIDKLTKLEQKAIEELDKALV